MRRHTITIAAVALLLILPAVMARGQVVSGPLNTPLGAGTARVAVPAEPNAPAAPARVVARAGGGEVLITPGRGKAYHTAGQLLDKSRLTVNYIDTPIEEVLEELRGLGVNIVALWPSTRIQGVEGGTTVNLRLRDVSAQVVLSQALAWVNASRNADLGWQLDADGIITIDRGSRLRQQRYIRMYNVSDLTGQMGYGQMGQMGHLQRRQEVRPGGLMAR